MSRYLVTGAAGFIGSSIASRLTGQGHEVWTIDNLSTGKKGNITPGVHFIEGDCQDQKCIEKLKGVQFDAIVHVAGQSSGEISFQDPAYDLSTNTESTLRLIQYALAHQCQRFIYASSMSVYGDVPDEPISELFVPKPLSFYGVGKMASEHYMRIYQSKGLNPTALRFFNVYGPLQNMGNLRQGMVSIYLAQLLADEQVIVKGSKDRFRDFIYIDDLVDLTVAIINDQKSFGGVYNVATGKKITVEMLLEKLLSISGLNKKIVYTGSTPGDQKGIYADISLIQKQFGFRTKVELDHGLEKMIKWAKSQVTASSHGR